MKILLKILIIASLFCCAQFYIIGEIESAILLMLFSILCELCSQAKSEIHHINNIYHVGISKDEYREELIRLVGEIAAD